MAAGRIVLVAVLFHALFAVVHSLTQRTQKSSMRKSKSSDFREMFSPPTMLLMSSPMERKVSYTQIDNFKSVGGVVLPILDGGLVGPYGLAWDAPRSALYICDAGIRKIYRVKLKAYKCKSQCKGIDIQLVVDGNKYTVVEGVVAQWASVDNDGNLFFTDQASKSVNKLSVDVIDKIINDELLPKDLGKTGEAEAAGEEAAKESAEGLIGDTTTKVTVTTPQPPSVFTLYETGVCPQVGTPAGVVAVGDQLYWANQVGGFSSGCVSEGKTQPRIKKPATEASGEAGAPEDAEPTFPSFKIANNTGSAYGLEVTTSKILFTETAHNVYGVSRSTGETVALNRGLLRPRGIVWDGDNTAYIADEEGNFIVSMPVGILKEGAPTSHVVDFHAPFGVALITKDDPVWDPLKSQDSWSGAHAVASANSFVMFVMSLAMVVVMA